MLLAYCLARFEELGVRGGIDGEQTLTHRLAETDAQHFHVEVGDRARALFRLAVAEPRDVVRLQCGEVAVALRSDEAGELFDHAHVTRGGGFLSLVCFCLRPLLAPRFDGRARQRFDVGRREHVAHTLRVFSALLPRSACRCVLSARPCAMRGKFPSPACCRAFSWSERRACSCEFRD
jgi:hypothetical protein